MDTNKGVVTVTTAVQTDAPIAPAVKLTRQDVINAYVFEGEALGYELTEEVANAILDLFDLKIIPRAMIEGHESRYFPTDDELDIVEPFMGVIMVHGTDSEPGTAHALTEQYFGEMYDSAFRIRHHLIETGSLEYCTVDTVVDVVCGTN